jgi:hypothetical protein
MNSRVVSFALTCALLGQPASALGNDKPIDPTKPGGPQVSPASEYVGAEKAVKPEEKKAKKKAANKRGAVTTAPEKPAAAKETKQ